MPDAVEAIDGLYEVGPEAFTAARDALAKTLRAAGDKEGAARVKALKRPPLTVWALNRVARDSPDAIGRVLDAGAALRQATQAALGGDASQLRAAQAPERHAIGAAIDVAAAVLAGSGHTVSEAARQTMERTLRAAIVDDTIEARLRSGTLQSDEATYGFDALPAMPATPVKRVKGGTVATPKADDDAEQEAARQQQARRRQAALAEAAARLTGTAERLDRKATEAERQAAEARREADAAELEAAAARDAASGAG